MEHMKVDEQSSNQPLLTVCCLLLRQLSNRCLHLLAMLLTMTYQSQLLLCQLLLRLLRYEYPFTPCDTGACSSH